MTELIDTEQERYRRRIETAPEILGYSSRRSVRAGGSIDFFISSQLNKKYDAQIIRLISPDIGPIGPSFKFSPIDAPLNGRHDGLHQSILPGSFAYIPGPLPTSNEFSIKLLVFPTLIDSRAQTIVEFLSPKGSRLHLTLSSEFGLRAVFESDSTICQTSVDVLRERAWTEIELSISAAEHTMKLCSVAHSKPAHIDIPTQSSSTKIPTDAVVDLANTSMYLAASWSSTTNRHEPISVFNGKLEHPRLFNLPGPNSKTTLIAEWDFSSEISTDKIVDQGSLKLDGILCNMPTRGVRGFTWSGNCVSWVHDPQGYGAIHFHDDDLADAGWNISHRYEVPTDLPSGCYALRLAPAANNSVDWYIPFFVRPTDNSQCSQVAFIVPTTTYGAYANMNLRVTAQFNELAHGRLTVLDSTDLLMIQMPELGKSTYDVHNDGSPVVYSSMNRPVTNFRPNGRMYKFCLDLMIVDWLAALDVGVDIITDDDIQHEGLEALRPYKVVVTSSHPEYVTRRQLDSLEQFIDSGGRLMYLGGNGFYSAAEIPENHHDVVEVRRPGQDNLWRVNHTEGLFSSSGLPSGLWRNIGRPENALVGVGFITQGFDECTFYRRSAASTDPRVSWIFEGLESDELIGDFGILQGGAAGYEIDRHDIARGSPKHSIVVASSSGHSPLYDLMVSSILDTLPQLGLSQDPIRADMVFFETNNGGAVFSVGSIAWAGSLSHNNYQNNVSTVTRNVLRRFMDPTPFLA
ncbi:MAG: N,N-dimethylformamidase beta subunit family domain-containing protein [Ilumatobacteraceae bacterium]